MKSDKPISRTAGISLLALAVLALACVSMPTVEQERRMARDISQQARREMHMLKDEVVERYITDIGNAIVSAAGPQVFDFEFSVVANDELNAMAAPGGNVFIHTGLILQVRNVSELAGVMAHEIAHVVKRHPAESMTRAQNQQLLRTIAIMGTGVVGGSSAQMAAEALTGVSALAYINRFSRENEREADEFALRVLPRAGYDPEGMVTMFETLQQRAGSSRSPVFLSSHPSTAERFTKARRYLAMNPPPPGLRRTDGGRLEIIQCRIYLLTGRQCDIPPSAEPGRGAR